MPEYLYIVIQEGVYRHSIFGVFSKREPAIRLARELAREDYDGWHSYTVIPFEKDVEVERSKAGWVSSPKAYEHKEIFTIRKEPSPKSTGVEAKPFTPEDLYNTGLGYPTHKGY